MSNTVATYATTYERPSLETTQDREIFVENDLPVFVAAAGWVALVFGSAWGFCKAVCGWNNVRSCDTSWLKVKATCRR